MHKKEEAVEKANKDKEKEIKTEAAEKKQKQQTLIKKEDQHFEMMHYNAVLLAVAGLWHTLFLRSIGVCTTVSCHSFGLPTLIVTGYV